MSSRLWAKLLEFFCNQSLFALAKSATRAQKLVDCIVGEILLFKHGVVVVNRVGDWAKFINNNDSWIVEGNYKSIAPERHDMADLVIFLNYNRFFCYKSAKRRYKMYKGQTRDDMAIGCEEKFDKEFKVWLLYKGRIKERRKRFEKIIQNKPNSLVFKNRRQLFEYYEENGIAYDK